MGNQCFLVKSMISSSLFNFVLIKIALICLKINTKGNPLIVSGFQKGPPITSNGSKSGNKKHLIITTTFYLRYIFRWQILQNHRIVVLSQSTANTEIKRVKLVFGFSLFSYSFSLTVFYPGSS